jgi:tetratricopeptide (TPR) repeat protein
LATPDPVDLCERADELARTGRSGEAIPLVEEAVPLLAARFGDTDGKVLDALRELGALYTDTGDFKGARATYERYLAACEAACGPDDPRRGGAHHYLAELFRTTRDYANAKLHAEACVAQWARVYAKDSPDELFVASALNNLAAIVARTGELTRAAEIYARALEIEERLGGADNPALATLLNNYANVLVTQNELAKAGAMLDRALGLVTTAYGPDHADASLVLHTMGHLAATEGRLGDAEKHLRRALAIEDAIPGKEPPTKAALLGYLGQVCDKRGATSDATLFFSRALAIYEAAYGKDDAKAATMRTALAKLASRPPERS